MKSLKTRMMLALGNLILLVCLGLGIVSFIAGIFAIGSTIKRDIRTIAEKTAANLELYVEGIIDTLEDNATSEFVEKLDTTPSKKNQILQNEAEKLDAIYVAVCNTDGSARYSNGTVIDVSSEEFFQKAVSGENFISDPQSSMVDDSLVIVYAVPITVGEQIVGVLVQENDGYELGNVVNQQAFGTSGEGIVINEDGTFVGSPNEDYVRNAYNAIEEGTETKFIHVLEQMSERTTGSATYRYAGERRNIGYAPVEGTSWMVGITMTHNEIYAPLINLMYQMIGATIVFVIISVFFVYFIVNRIAMPIKLASVSLNQISNGDLTGTVEGKITKRKDEIGQMGKALQVMQDSILSIISNMKENSNSLSEKSNELNGNSQEIYKLSNNITNAISEIAEGTSVQSNELVDITAILEQFNEKLQTMIVEIDDVDNTSRKINQMAAGSSKEMNDLNDSVVNIQNTFVNFEAGINKLGTSIAEINNITNMITDVANQTNMLALNASIEAARAGEAGKGFAVVASEIGSLADQSRNSSASITELINEIAKSTQAIIAEAKGMGSELNEQVETINRSVASFQSIIGEIGVVMPKIQKVKDSGSEIEKDKNSILTKIDEISSVSEEICASTEEIAASTEEMNGSISNVADSANELNHMTDDMLEQVGQFKTE